MQPMHEQTSVAHLLQARTDCLQQIRLCLLSCSIRDSRSFWLATSAEFKALQFLSGLDRKQMDPWDSW